MKCTVAVAQCCHPADGDVVGMVEEYCRRAAGRGADLLVFPESLMTRYEAELGAFLAAAEPLGGAFSTAVDALSARYGLWMVYTMNELNPAGNPFNTAVVVDGQGRKAGVYRKVHLFDTDFTRESDRMSAGDALFEPVDAPFGKLGLGICYDLRFPEVARFAALRGADIMVYPAAWVSGEGKARQWLTLLAARAIEGEMFVVGACRSDEGYGGCSCVVSPTGEVVAEAGPDEELLVAEIDMSDLGDVRRRMPVLQHRKAELYE